MLVPAIAFSWWLMSLPASPAPPAFSIATSTSTSSTASESGHASAETARGALAPPVRDRALYRGIVTSEMARVARTFLELPMGAERFADVDGRPFVFVLERHYHPPGFVGAPTGWHKGVTVYEVL